MKRFFSSTAAIICSILVMTGASSCGKAASVKDKKAVNPAVIESLKKAHSELIGLEDACMTAEKEAKDKGSVNAAAFFRAAALSDRILMERHNKILRVYHANYVPSAPEKTVPASYRDAAKDIRISEFPRPVTIKELPPEITSAAFLLDCVITEQNRLGKAMLADEDLEHTYYLCTVCGYLTDKEPEDKCPICNSFKDRIKTLVDGGMPKEADVKNPLSQAIGVPTQLF